MHFLFFLTGVFFSQTYITDSQRLQLTSAALIPLRLHQNEYPHINPLLLCDVGNSADSVQNKGLSKIITNFVSEQIKKGVVTEMSVYLQRYGGGGWVGVNETSLYAPASLLKVPLMIAYYKIAQTTPGFLDVRVTYKGTDHNSSEYFKSPNTIKTGVSYSIEELVQNMIADSDNSATILLHGAMDPMVREDTFRDLGLPAPPNSPDAEYISVKNYAYFFRILYNATYLNREYSERALKHLAEADFVQGIRAGVPAGVIVAQKFGERTALNTDGSINHHELHDCGIVYKKNSHYLLCIMSKGSDFSQMAKNISDLSKLVYDAVTLPPSPTPD